jgi:hypothetical protein
VNNYQRFNSNMKLYKQLKSGETKPKEIVGTGYRYPKSVATAWLLRQLWQDELGTAPNELHVMTNGELFADYKQASRSKVFSTLCKNGYERLDGLKVTSFGIRPCPVTDIDGYIVYVKVGNIQKLAA